MKRAVLITAVGYLVALIVCASLMHSNLNSHWLIKPLLFAPRWILAVPLIFLMPVTLRVHPRWTLIYPLHGLVIVFPILGFQLPSPRPQTGEYQNVLRVMTCNLGGGVLDEVQFVRQVRDRQIDILLLQECSQEVSKSLFDQLQWSHHQAHQIVIASPHVLGEMSILARQPKSNYRVVAAIACELDLPAEGRVRVVSLHLPTFRPALEKLQTFDAERAPNATEALGQIYHRVAEQIHDSVADTDLATIIGGDFNVPVESVFYRNYWSEYQNAFLIAGTGLGYTKYTRFHGVRIDHLLADDRWAILTSDIGPDLGGDHRPLIVELARIDSP